MKKMRSLVTSLGACGIVLAMATTLAAQTPVPGTAKVVRIKGSARYSTGNNVWLPLKVGASLKPGTIIQTAKTDAYVDLVLGGSDIPMPSPVSAASASAKSGASGLSYQPSSEQNVVRILEDSALAIDKLMLTQTGADVVSETQLDLQRGKILGNVKKMSAASKYEVKIPNGVAGIRGTVYYISADGVVKVFVGSVVLAYVGPDGTVVTQVVMGGQQFDAKTGQITPVSSYDQSSLDKFAKESSARGYTPTIYALDYKLYYVSPTTTQNSGGGD